METLQNYGTYMQIICASWLWFLVIKCGVYSSLDFFFSVDYSHVKLILIDENHIFHNASGKVMHNFETC